MYSERPTLSQSPTITHSHSYDLPLRMLSQAVWSSDSLPLHSQGRYSSSTSNAGSVSSNDRTAIDLMLNPILDSSSNTQSRITLPSIWTLGVHRYASQDLPPLDSLNLNLKPQSAYPHSASYYTSPTSRINYLPLQSNLSTRKRHLFKRIKARRGSHSSSACSSVSPPSSPSTTYSKYTPIDSNITSCPMDQQEQYRHTAAYAQSQQGHQQHHDQKHHKSVERLQQQSKQGHLNKKYTTDEMHFIQYFREDKRMQWADIVGPFNEQFPNHKRERGALECRYYRFQMYPMVNDDGTFQYDDKGEIRMVNTKVRDRRNTERSGGKKWAVLNDYFKLVSRCPEQVLEYSWTDEEDKRRARAIIHEREKTGLTHLPGALLRSRSSL